MINSHLAWRHLFPGGVNQASPSNFTQGDTSKISDRQNKLSAFGNQNQTKSNLDFQSKKRMCWSQPFLTKPKQGSRMRLGVTAKVGRI